MQIDGTIINYTYDASGNRISKTVQATNQGVASVVSTYYVRDASGNVMSIYTSGVPTVNSSHLTQSEIDLYGSSRLGVYNVTNDVQNCNVSIDSIGNFIRGNKFFELTNHLGNVLVTVSDRKLAVDSNNDGTIDYYNANVVTANDYYPFGQGINDRQFTLNNSQFRYGFNGKEKDLSINGTNSDYDFNSRIYDSRIAKWFSLDPLQKMNTGESNYIFTSDNPIIYVDKDGRKKIIYYTVISPSGKSTTIKKVYASQFVYEKVEVPGAFKPNKYYESDLTVNITVDLSKKSPIVTIKSEEGLPEEISSGTYYIHKAGEIIDDLSNSDKSRRGKQKTGLTFTSTFAPEMDGPKTDATEGTQGGRNIDFLMGALNAAGEDGEALKFEIEDLPEWVKLGQELIDATKEEADNKKASADAAADVPKPPAVHDTVNSPDPKDVVRDVNDGSVRSYESSSGPTVVPSNNSTTPDTMRTTNYPAPPSHAPSNQAPSNQTPSSH